MTPRWRRGCIAAGTALALVLAAPPAQADTEPDTQPDTQADTVDTAAGPDQALAASRQAGTFGTAATGIAFAPTLSGCTLTVPGVITFPDPADPDPDPAIVGTAEAVTTARVDASCADAQAAPPGTFADTFVCTGTFTGTIAGVPVTAPLRYQGVTAPGGSIDAGLFIGGPRIGATLIVEGRVLQGGTYSGVVRA